MIKPNKKKKLSVTSSKTTNISTREGVRRKGHSRPPSCEGASFLCSPCRIFRERGRTQVLSRASSPELFRVRAACSVGELSLSEGRKVRDSVVKSGVSVNSSGGEVLSDTFFCPCVSSGAQAASRAPRFPRMRGARFPWAAHSLGFYGSKKSCGKLRWPYYMVSGALTPNRSRPLART